MTDDPTTDSLIAGIEDSAVDLSPALKTELATEHTLALSADTLDTCQRALEARVDSDTYSPIARTIARTIHTRLAVTPDDTDVTLSGADWHFLYGAVTTWPFEDDAPADTVPISPALADIERDLPATLTEHLRVINEATTRTMEALEREDADNDD